MKYDKPLVALLLGILSIIPYELFTQVFKYAGIAKYSVFELSSLIVTLDRPTPSMGAVVTALVGGTIGMILYYSLKKLGWDYLLFKSLVVGLLSWVFIEATYVWLIEGPKLIKPRPVNDYFVELFGSVVFGISLGLLFQKYLLKEHAQV